MARTSGPLGSLSASGTIGGLLTSSNWKGRSYTRKRGLPKAIPTETQTILRILMGFLGHAWSTSLSNSDRTAWDAIAKKTNISPINAFIAESMLNAPATFAPHKLPGAIPGGVDPTFLTGPTITPGVGLATYDWELAAINDGWAAFFFAIFDPGGANVALLQSAANLNAPPGPQRLESSKLKPGTYVSILFLFTNSGQISNPGAFQGPFVI